LTNLTTQMVTNSLLDSTSSTFSLHQVALWSPDSSESSHVIMRSEQLYFGFARVNDKTNIINSDWCFGNISSQNNLFHKYSNFKLLSIKKIKSWYYIPLWHDWQPSQRRDADQREEVGNVEAIIHSLMSLKTNVFSYMILTRIEYKIMLTKYRVLL
jgi:hypothetical protein